MSAKYLLLIASLLLLPAIAMAQVLEPGVVVPEGAVVFTSGNFFIAVIAGVILAVGFQLFLTHVSLAAGLSALGSATDPDRAGEKKEESREPRKAKEGGSLSRTVRKVNTAFGLWTIVTTAVALFFASWLGVRLGVTFSLFTGAILGLTIWALSYVTTTILEMKAVSSLASSLGHAATSTLRGGFRAVHSVVGKSPEDRIAEAAVDAAKKVRKEVFSDIHLHDLKKEVDHYVEELRTLRDPKRMRKEIAQLLDDVELHAIVHSGNMLIQDQEIEMKLQTGGYTKEDAQKAAHEVTDAFSKIREEAQQQDKSTVDKVADAAMRVTGKSPSEAQDLRMKVENYLRQTGQEELNPEGIKHDIELLVHDPQAGKEALRERVAQFDCDTVKAVLHQRGDISSEKADQIADTVCNVMRSVGSTAGDIKSHIVEKVGQYMSLGQSKIGKVQGISHGFMEALRKSGTESDSYVEKLRRLDHNTIREMLATHSDLSQEEADRAASKIEHARDSAIEKWERMECEVKTRTEAAKHEIMRDVDETRKAAASAAWWALTAAVVSGVAAVLGGMLGVIR